MKTKLEATAHRTLVQTKVRAKRNSTRTNAYVPQVTVVNIACAYVLLSRADMPNVKVQTMERDSDVFVLNSTLVSGFFFSFFLFFSLNKKNLNDLRANWYW